MSHSVCPACQLRFTPAQAAGLPSCPVCGGAVEALSGAQSVMGLALFTPDADAPQLPEAISVAMPTNPAPNVGPGPQIS